MPKGLVVYDSKTGNTEKMAVAICEGMKNAGLDAEAKRVENTTMSELTQADAIVFGSPTYFANMTSKMKEFIDKTVAIYPNQLENKIGAAFSSWDGIGAESTLLSLIMAMLLHKMIIVGHQSSGFGAISLGTPDDKGISQCKAFGERIASITRALSKS